MERDDMDPNDMDPNDIARLAAGRASPSARAAIHARLTEDDAAVVAAVASAAADRAAIRPRARWVWAAAAAAAVLFAVGAWVLRPDEDVTAPLGDADLVAAFAALRQADVETFEGLTPLLVEERLGGRAPVERGGLRVVGPFGAILDTRPVLRWSGVAGAAAYVVEVLSDEGEVVLEARPAEAQHVWPDDAAPLQPGAAYVLRVVTSVAGVHLEGARAFRVLDEAAQARYQRALAVVDETVDRALRPVVRAHVALRLELWAEALRQLDSGRNEGGRVAAAGVLESETRVHVMRAMGED